MHVFRSVRPLAGLAALAVLFACGLSACQGSQEPVTMRIGVALYRQDDTFVSTLVQQLEQQAKEREGGRKINLNVVDGRGSQLMQNEQVDRFLAKGYDIVCVNIVDRTAAAVLIDKARAAGVPLLFFNREPVEEDMMRWDKVFYIGSEATQSGLLQGILVLKAWKTDPDSIDRNRDGVLQYVMLEGEAGHQDALLRTENSVRVLTRAGIPTEKLANDTADWQRGKANTRVAQWIEQFGERIEVIFSNNDDMALGAIDALLDAGCPPDSLPFVVGVDATPPALQAVEDGTLKGTVQNDAAGQARAMLDLACALFDGENPNVVEGLTDGKYIRLRCSTVTRENLRVFLPEEGGKQEK